MDNNNIYMVNGTSVSTYFTLDEATSQVGLESAAYFLDLDMGPDGLLYIMLIGTKPTTGGSATIVAQSGGPHLATKWRDLSTYTASRMSVVSSGKVGFIDYSGFSTATAQSQSLVYAASLLEDVYGCAAQCLVGYQPLGGIPLRAWLQRLPDPSRQHRRLGCGGSLRGEPQPHQRRQFPV